MKAPPGFTRLTAILLAVVVTGVVAIVFWRNFAQARPLVAGLAAGTAAFLAPLSALVEKETHRKWTIAVIIAAVVGLGTWYASDSLEREKDASEYARNAQSEVLVDAAHTLPSRVQSAILNGIGLELRERFNNGEFDTVLKTAVLLAKIDKGNGNVTYYEGEAYHALRARTQMRGAFMRYLQRADHEAYATKGVDVDTCYRDDASHGYCAERTSFITHELANDYYETAV